MKYLVNFFLLLSLVVYKNAQSQIVDSVAIRLTEQSKDSIFWTFYLQNIDSFSQGTIKATLTREWMNNSWVNKLLGENIHSPVVDSITTQRWNGQWDNFFRYIYYHNAQGLDSLIYWQQWYGSWNNLTRLECTYNADSSLATRINSSWNNTISQWENYTYEYWSKDSLGRDTSLTTDRYNNGMWTPFKRDNFTYDSLGNRISEVGNYWDNTDSLYWLTYYGNSWVFDSLNRVIGSFYGYIPGGHGHDYYYYYQDNSLSDNWSYFEANSGDETWTHTHYFNNLSNNVYAFLPADYFICDNDSFPIGGFAFGGQQPLQFSWSPSGGLLSDTIENPYIIADTSTTYYFTVTDANNISSTDSIQITVHPSTAIDSVVTIPASCAGCYDGSFTIYNGGTFNHYSITPDSGVTVTGNVISGLSSQTYIICVEDQNNCMTCISDSIGISTGINERQSIHIFLSTNPFSGFTDIHCNLGNGQLILDIYDAMGKKVKEMKVVSPVTRFYRGNLNDGIYYGVLRNTRESVGRIKFILVHE